MGFKVGVHYCMYRRQRIPDVGDPGYVNWFHNRVKKEVEKINADFIFFDEPVASSSYFRTPELVAWFYNYADKRGKDVWVNDDLGCDINKKSGDVLEGKGFTMSGVSSKTWMSWFISRNQWNGWINEFGMLRKGGSGERWEWKYRTPEELLHVFIDMVAKGGVWCVQMVNTKKAWEIMWEIGDWFEINGETIYGTRPFLKPDPECILLPQGPVQKKYG